MEYRIATPSVLKRRIAVSVSVHEVDQAIDDALRLADDSPKVGETAETDFPGPLFSEAVLRRATEALVEKGITAILDEHDFFPVNRIWYEGPLAERGKPLSYTLSLDILPEIPLPERLETLSVEVEEPVVSPRALRERLHHLLRAKGGRLDPVHERRLPQDGDVLEIDITAAHAGSPVPGMGANGFLLQLKPGQFDMDVAQLARTLHVGETASGTVLCPLEYPDVSLRGKPVEITVRLRSIRREILPQPDEAFAVSIGFPSLRALHERLFMDCLERKMEEHRKAAEAKLLATVLESLEFPLPESLVAIHLKTVLMELRRSLSEQGYAGEELERLLEEKRETGLEVARREARIQTMLMVLGYREGLSVGEGDIEKAVKTLSGRTRDIKAVRRKLEETGAIWELRDRLLAEKALYKLYAKAKKTVVDSKGRIVEDPRSHTASSLS